MRHSNEIYTDPQLLFDFVAEKLSKQKYKATDKYNCKYRIKRGNKTLKCAVGHVLPNKYYMGSYENVSIDMLFAEEPSLDHWASLFNSSCTSLLYRLQVEHDCLETDHKGKFIPDVFYNVFSRIAADKGLNTIRLKELYGVIK